MTGPHTSPGYWLHHAALIWRRVCEQGLGDTTYPQFNVLSAVSQLTAGRPAGPTQQEVADFARMDRMMASKLIRALAERGLLDRLGDARDARRWRLALTETGRATLRRCIAAARRADDEVFGPDSAALRDQLRAIAERAG